MGTVALCAAAAATPGMLATGCAQTREVAQIMTAPVGARDGSERAYDDGYRLGRRDAASELLPDSMRHARRFDLSTEKSFSTGYGDGYAGRPSRMGKPSTRDWVEGR